MVANLNRDDSFLMNESSPEIYVACLASYNAGKLHGKWLDATLEIEELLEEIKALLAKSAVPNAEEFAIHGCGGFYSLAIGEYEGLESVREKALFIKEYGALGAAVLNYYGGDLKDASEAIEDYYRGEYKNKLDYAVQFFDEIYLDSIPKHLYFYIDYEAFKTDIFITDYFSIEVQGHCHVFERH